MKIYKYYDNIFDKDNSRIVYFIDITSMSNMQYAAFYGIIVYSNDTNRYGKVGNRRYFVKSKCASIDISHLSNKSKLNILKYMDY